jgi:hypothetical protein
MRVTLNTLAPINRLCGIERRTPTPPGKRLGMDAATKANRHSAETGRAPH